MSSAKTMRIYIIRCEHLCRVFAIDSIEPEVLTSLANIKKAPRLQCELCAREMAALNTNTGKPLVSKALLSQGAAEVAVHIFRLNEAIW